MAVLFLHNLSKLAYTTLKLNNILCEYKNGTVLERSIPKLGLPSYRWLPSICLGIGINRYRRLKIL
jgi:hypothetical protein